MTARHDDGPHARAPLPGESFDGYLAYRSALAMMPGPFAIAALGGAVHAGYPELAFGPGGIDDGLAAVADAVEVDVAELRGMAHPLVAPGRRAFGRTDVDGRMLEKRTRRFAPSSLARSPHHRSLWAVRCLPFCEEGWETLTDRCPATYCGAVQRWRRGSGVDRCDACGGPLTDPRNVVVVPEERREDLRSLCGLLHHDSRRTEESLARLPPTLADLAPGSIVEAACAIAGLQDPDLRSRAGMLRNPIWLADRIVPAMAWASRALRDWPVAGERLAGRRLATRTGRFGDGNGGATLAFVAMADDPAFGTGARRVAAMLGDALRSNRSRGLAIGEAVVGTGLSVSGMATQRRLGAVETIMHLTEVDRVLPLISRASVATLRRGRPVGPPLRDVAALLGVPCHGVEQLLDAGLLVPATGQAGPSYGPFAAIDAASPPDLLRKLEAVSHPELIMTEPLTLADVARQTGGDLRPWDAWIGTLLRGELPCLIAPGDTALTTRLFLDAASLEDMRGMVASGGVGDDRSWPLMYRVEASEVLGLQMRNRRTAFAEWPMPADRGPAVPVLEVRRLAAAWMSSSELGSVLGTSYMAAYHLAVSHGLEPSTFGFERAAALRLAASGASTRLRPRSRRIRRAAPAPDANGSAPPRAGGSTSSPTR